MPAGKQKRGEPPPPRLSHNVYVVELAPDVLRDRRFRKRNPGYVDGQPCVYVGMTGLAVAERFKNHKRGHKGNVFVLRFGIAVAAGTVRAPESDAV